MNSAFPNFEFAEGEGHCAANRGLSKRELYAAMAMQAIVQSDTTAYHDGKGAAPTSIADYIAQDAVKLADALIAELDK